MLGNFLHLLVYLARAEAFVLVTIKIHIQLAETKVLAVLQVSNIYASESRPICYDAMLVAGDCHHPFIKSTHPKMIVLDGQTAIINNQGNKSNRYILF